MSDLALVALATVVPFGLVGFVAYKMLTRKKRPELKLVEQPFWDGELKKAQENLEKVTSKAENLLADKAVKEVVAKAKKINKNKARRGKRRAKKN